MAKLWENYDWESIIKNKLTKRLYTHNFFIKKGIVQFFIENFSGNKKEVADIYHNFKNRGSKFNQLDEDEFIERFKKTSVKNKSFLYAIYKRAIPINPLTFKDDLGKPVNIENAKNMIFQGGGKALEIRLFTAGKSRQKTIPISLALLRPPQGSNIWINDDFDALLPKGLEREVKILKKKPHRLKKVATAAAVPHAAFYQFVTSGKFEEHIKRFYLPKRKDDIVPPPPPPPELPPELPPEPRPNWCLLLQKYVETLQQGGTVKETDFQRAYDGCLGEKGELLEECDIDDSDTAVHVAKRIHKEQLLKKEDVADVWEEIYVLTGQNLKYPTKRNKNKGKGE